MSDLPALPPSEGALRPEWLENYRHLVQKVDDFARSVEQSRVTAGAPLACARACSACCFTRLTVLPVEAASIRGWLDAGPGLEPGVGAGPDRPPPGPKGLRGPHPCVFLDRRGDCAVYAVRPILCRTHGLPIQLETGRDICPLSGRPAVGQALNLTTINALLTAVNARFCEQSGVPDARVPLESLRAEAAGLGG